MPAKLFARGVVADRFHSASSVASYVTSLSPLCDRSGIALVHNGEVAHAGNAITRGSRYVLVAFFHGGEKPAPPLPPPTPPPAEGAKLSAEVESTPASVEPTPELCEHRLVRA